MNSSKQIKMGTVLSYFAILFNIAAGLIYTPWMISQIGTSDYGLYTLANSVISLFVVDFGLSATTTRYVSKYIAEGRLDKANEFLGAVYKLYLLIDSIIFILLIVVFSCIDSIYSSLTVAELEKLKVVYCIAGLYTIINFPFITLNGILNANEKFIQLKLSDVMQKVLSIVLMIIMLSLGLGLYALVLVNAIAGLFSTVYKLVVISKTTSLKPKFKNADKKVYKSIFSFSLWTTVSSLAQRLIFNITPTILGSVSNAAQIAVFGIIQTIEQYIYTIANAINGMFMPKISRIYADGGDDSSILSLMINVGRFQFAINGLIVSVFAVIGKEFIFLWMGEDFSSAYVGVLLIAIAGLFYNPLQIGNTAMVVKNKVRLQAIIALVMGLVNVSCSVFLSRKNGALGAAISVFIACVVRDVLYHIAHKKVMQIDILRFIKECYLRMLPPILIVIVSGVIIDSMMSNISWWLLVVKGMFLVLLYIITLVLFCLSKQEKAQIKKLILR